MRYDTALALTSRCVRTLLTGGLGITRGSALSRSLMSRRIRNCHFSSLVVDVPRSSAPSLPVSDGFRHTAAAVE